MNDSVRCNFVTRARIISYVRRFFDEQGFLEVSCLTVDFVAYSAVGCHSTSASNAVSGKIAPTN